MYFDDDDIKTKFFFIQNLGKACCFVRFSKHQSRAFPCVSLKFLKAERLFFKAISAVLFLLASHPNRVLQHSIYQE